MNGDRSTGDRPESGTPPGSAGPHIRSGESVAKIMWSVVAALVPAVAYSVYLFGFAALTLICVSVFSAVCAETMAGLALRRRIAVLDGSAVITGLLLAMILPPLAPWWMAALGSSAAIILGKQVFGGLGRNILNPALAARAVLAVLWPENMSRFWFPDGGNGLLPRGSSGAIGPPLTVYDVITQAAPLASTETGRMIGAGALPPHAPVPAPAALKTLLIGNTAGYIGEVSALLLLAGAVFLFARKIISWRIPASLIGAAAACLAVFYMAAGNPFPLLPVLFYILTGGTILGAFFMATDTVTSPVTGRGMLLFGAGCGLLTFLIRTVGGRPDGIFFAILIMNALVPLIDRYVRPRVFGSRWKRKSAKSRS